MEPDARTNGVQLMVYGREGEPMGAGMEMKVVEFIKSRSPFCSMTAEDLDGFKSRNSCVNARTYSEPVLYFLFSERATYQGIERMASIINSEWDLGCEAISYCAEMPLNRN